jgi:nicotinate phosphoribosyltransferase
MKLSDDPSKSTFGGIHQVRRFKRSGKICGDIIYDERIGCAGKSMMTNGGEEYNSVDFEDLLVPIFINGRKVYKNPLIDQIRDVACKNLEVLPDSCRMLKDPNLYPLYWEENLAQINWNIAENIIKKIRKNDNAKSSYNNRSPE